MGTLSEADYLSRDAVGLAELIRSGAVSAAEVVEAAIVRAEAVNPRINAIAAKRFDAARREAAAAATGPLAGVPYALKDLGHPIAGMPITSGSRAFRDVVATENSELADRVQAAGLINICTTTTPEFGLTVTTESALYGATRNPWNLDHSAGGSSGGAAALVAAGVLPAAHATDGGGSIRIPASCCGLFGLKVSRGRTPVGVGRTEGWNGCGVSHAVSRSVRDSAVLLDVTHGAPLGARYVAPPPAGSFAAAVARDPRKLRIAVQRRPLSGVPVDPECAAAIEDAARLCEQLGHIVEEASPDIGEDLAPHFTNVIAAHTAATVNQREEVLGRKVDSDELETVTHVLVGLGRSLTALDIVAADQAFMRGAIALARFQQTYDIILTVTLAAPPARIGVMSLDQPAPDYGRAVGAYSPFTALYNMTGQPAMSVPLAWSAAGLPIGIHFAGRLGEEELLLSLAGQLERARPWAGRRAPL